MGGRAEKERDSLLLGGGGERWIESCKKKERKKKRNAVSFQFEITSFFLFFRSIPTQAHKHPGQKRKRRITDREMQL